MSLNIRGLKSKIRSLVNIIEEIQPTIFSLTETHLAAEDEAEIDRYFEEEYKIYYNSRNKDGGGVLIGMQKRLKNISVVVEKNQEIEESLWIVMDNTKTALRIGAIYAPQESRTSTEDYEKMYENLSKQILIAKQKDQKVLMMGDLNCKVGDRIEGNTTEISKSGKNLLQLIKSNRLKILNETEKCEGLWTRMDGKSKSVLDYLIIDRTDEPAFTSMLIDEEGEYAPKRQEVNNKSTSDHNMIIARFNWMIDNETPKEAKKMVITTKGYSRIKKEINERKLSKIWERNETFEVLYGEWKQEIDNIVNKNTTCIKKTNKRKSIKLMIRTKKHLKKEAKKASKEKRYQLVGKIKLIDERINKEDQKQHQDKLEKVVEKLKHKNGLNVPNMWEIVKKIKKKKEEPMTAIKSKDGKMIEDPEDIKARYLEHFVEILKNKPAETDLQKNQEELINTAFERILQIAEKKETILTTRDEVCGAVSELKRRKCKDKTGWKNEMILETGEDTIDSLHAMMNKMEKERYTPNQWSEMKIKAINKPGSGLIMDNKRGLFITDIISKIYEKVMKKRNDEKISAFLSDYQTGGVKWRSANDCLLLLSETIRLKKKAGKKCYLVFGDAVKCFDKLWLKDSLVELFKAGVEAQDIQMMFKMNKDTVIEVETPCGTTEKVSVGEIVKQGTVLGPTLCCVSTDQINKIAENQERSIGNEYIAILIFIDDVMSAGNANEARKAIRSFKVMEDLKKYTYGLKKTKVMVTNNGKDDEEEIEEEVSMGKITKTDEYKYVGFHLNKDANCLFHIEHKNGSIKGQITALKSIANYYNVGPKFILVRLYLYEACIVHSLLHGIEAWNRQTKTELKNLEKIQAYALCQILELPRSTPYIGLLSELGMWRIQERIDYRRIMYTQNLLKSDDRRLAKRVILDQKESEEEDTFYDTAKQRLEKYGVDIDMIADMKKSELKKTVKERINNKMEGMFEETAKKMKKLRFITDFKCKRKEYFTQMDGFECLQTIKTRLNMLPVYANYRADVSMQSTCEHCGKVEDNTEHLVECEVLGETIITKENLKDTSNAHTWRLINERVRFNLDNRLNQK